MIRTDVVIIGAGPVGLFQVFELGLLDLKAEVIEAMPQIGGQCAELYPDKPIYDIPALPVCGAKELIDRLLEQIKPFNAGFHLGQEVTDIARGDDGRFRVRTHTGTGFDAGAVVVAAGLGAFTPRRLEVPEAAALEEKSLHYKVRDPKPFAGRHLVIAGGGDSALDWTLQLVDTAASLVLVHRSPKFRAAPASVKRMQALCDELRMQTLEGDIVGLDAEGERLRAVRVRSRAGVIQRIEADELLVFYGLHPRLGPIAEFGLALDGSQIAVDTARFQSSVPGIYAVGDIAVYPGKKKLILSGFHEAALAAFAIREQLNAGQKVHLQYTTTSPIMHKRLGLDPAAAVADLEPAA